MLPTQEDRLGQLGCRYGTGGEEDLQNSGQDDVPAFKVEWVGAPDKQARMLCGLGDGSHRAARTVDDDPEERVGNAGEFVRNESVV